MIVFAPHEKGPGALLVVEVATLRLKKFLLCLSILSLVLSLSVTLQFSVEIK